MKIDRIARIALLLVQAVPAAWAEPSFQAIDAEPLGAVPEKALVLHAGWQLKDASPEADGVAVSKVGYEAKGWFETTVPTTVLGALVRHGVYPDPYVGMNNMRIPDADDQYNARHKLMPYSHLPDKSNPWQRPWWFRTEFPVPKEYSGRTVWLHLDGLNYRAEVWLNGVKIASAGELVGMFRRFRLDVTKVAKPGAANALAVRIQGPDIPGDPWYEALKGMNDHEGATGFGILENVTAIQAAGSSNWRAVRDRNMGLWQHVWIEATGPVAVRDPGAFPEVKGPDSSEVPVTVRAFLEPSAASKLNGPVEVVVRIEPDGFEGEKVEVRKQVRLNPGAETEVTLAPGEFPNLVYKQPRLWWPVTYGEQPLYRLIVEAWSDGKLSSSSRCFFGMRTVRSEVRPLGGRVWIVNGRTIRMTGGGWMPDSLMSWSAQRYRDEVRLMADAYHTVVRINGTGVIVPDVFFDACDRRGVLVWQDMVRSGQTRKVSDAFVPIYRANMEDSIRRMRGHASMLVYCGANEVLPDERLGRLLQDDLLPRLDPGRPWIVSSGSNATWAKERIGTTSFGPYGNILLSTYFKFYRDGGAFTCKNEIGLPSPPPLNSVARFLTDMEEPDPEAAPLSLGVGFHDGCGYYFRTLDNMLRHDLGSPATMAEYLAMADLYNDACYRAIWEAANNGRPRNSGTHLWKSNAAWGSFLWQLFDWYMRPNAGYYSSRSACKPLHVQASLDDFGVQVVSTLAAARSGLQVHIAVFGLDGKPEAEETRSANVPADATLQLGALPKIVIDGRMHIVALDLLDEKGAELDHTVYWIQKDHLWQELMKAAPALVKATILEQGTHKGEIFYRIRVENTSPVPALQVWLEILLGSMGEEVLPSFWSENAFTMLPGEQREVSVRFRPSLLKGANPHLAVGGWNAVPQEMSIVSGAITKMDVEVSSASARRQELHFSAEQRSVTGTRYTTWMVPVWMDGQLLRYVRVGLRGGEKTAVPCPLLPLPPGKHTFAVGDGKLPAGELEIPEPLWKIGASDGTPRDLHYDVDAGLKAQSGADFTVGVSDAAKDWPALHPGKKNTEAAEAARTNVVRFEVKEPLQGTGAYLMLKFMDFNAQALPSFVIDLNGCKREVTLIEHRAKGSLTKPELSMPFRQIIVFPEGTVKPGENILKITNRTGSWVVYDGLEFHLLQGQATH